MDQVACLRAFFRAFLAAFFAFADDAASETGVLLGASASVVGVDVVGVDFELFEGRSSGDPSSP